MDIPPVFIFINSLTYSIHSCDCFNLKQIQCHQHKLSKRIKFPPLDSPRRPVTQSLPFTVLTCFTFREKVFIVAAHHRNRIKGGKICFSQTTPIRQQYHNIIRIEQSYINRVFPRGNKTLSVQWGIVIGLLEFRFQKLLHNSHM